MTVGKRKDLVESRDMRFFWDWKIGIIGEWVAEMIPWNISFLDVRQ